MTQTIRIGAVTYLNTKPLIHRLAELAPDAKHVLDLPSSLAEMLEVGELDVALIPVIEYFRSGSYKIVPNIAIGSNGPVLSVTLFSRVPWPRIRRVALDVGSRTSAGLDAGAACANAMAWIQKSCRCRWMPQAEDVDADAVLLIGDRAMRACLPGFTHAFDLGQEWHDWVGLPFVYAVWAVREGVDLGPVEAALHEAKRLGCREVGQIAFARSAAARPGRRVLPALSYPTSSASTLALASKRGFSLSYAGFGAGPGPAGSEP